ncbi:hypothetical protein DsansV1_C11g0107761 [Dioscorea sansibarensis]
MGCWDDIHCRESKGQYLSTSHEHGWMPLALKKRLETQDHKTKAVSITRTDDKTS